MKITYEFVTGEVSGVEVDEHLGGMLLDLDRQQDNDKAGNHILSWVDYYTCHAYVNNLSGKEYWEAAQLNAEKEVFFLIRYCSEAAAIDTEHFRILFRGQVYNITFIDNVKYQNKTIKLRAALEKRGG